MMPGKLITKTWLSNSTVYAPARYRRACRYAVFLPDRLADLSVQLPVSATAIVSEADHAVRDLNDRAHPALVPLARLLLRTESIASSRVEGLQTGAFELARAEVRASSGARASNGAMEILGNINAMELAIRETAAVERVGVAEIIAIHRRLMESAPNARIAGKLRTEQNWIGGNDYNPCGADFVPPPPEDVEALLEDLCNFANDDGLPAVVQAALVHAQFETIHPFDDGNGRTGRALIHVVLRRRLGLAYIPPISVVFAARRDRYIEGLTTFRGLDGSESVAPWIEQFAAAVAQSAHLARGYLTAVEELKTEWRDKLTHHGAPRMDAAAWALIDLLPGFPIITGPVAVANLGRARAAVYQGIQQLTDAGVLRALSSSERNQAWEAVGLFDLLLAFEAGESPDAVGND